MDIDGGHDLPHIPQPIRKIGRHSRRHENRTIDPGEVSYHVNGVTGHVSRALTSVGVLGIVSCPFPCYVRSTMTRQFAAIAAVVIASGLIVEAVYLAGTMGPFMMQHYRLMGFLGIALGGIGSSLAAVAIMVRKRQPSH